MLLDYTRIIGRAAFVRHKSKMLDAKPPFSIRRIMEVAFPGIHVTGSKLPDGVVEMCERRGNRRTIFYNRKYSHATQRVGIAHALFHLIGDMKNGTGMAECNVALRELERSGAVPTD